MKVERSISAGPRRSTSQLSGDLTAFLVGVLAARSYPDAERIREQLKAISAMLGMLLVRRVVATPAVTLRTGDMEVSVSVSYEVDGVEDLTMPTMTLLGDLDKDAPVEIQIFVTEDVEGALARSVSEASDGPAAITLAVASMPDVQQDEASAPPSDTAIEPPRTVDDAAPGDDEPTKGVDPPDTTSS